MVFFIITSLTKDISRIDLIGILIGHLIFGVALTQLLDWTWLNNLMSEEEKKNDMQLLGLILLLASSWYLWKLTSNFLDEPTKKELSNSLNNLKNKFSEGKQNFSKAKISEAWEKYKEEGGALSNKEKS